MVTKGLREEGKEIILGMKIFRDLSENLRRVPQYMFSNRTSIMILLGDTIHCRRRVVCLGIMMKKKKVRGHVYMQFEAMHISDLHETSHSIYMSMLDRFDCGLQMKVHVYVDYGYTICTLMTVMGI